MGTPAHQAGDMHSKCNYYLCWWLSMLFF